MPVPPASPQDAHAAVVFLCLIIGCILARFWRTALLVILGAALALAVYGTVVGIDTVSSFMTAHHR
jgi:CHASE2 domain-containing sensor protein